MIFQGLIVYIYFPTSAYVIVYNRDPIPRKSSQIKRTGIVLFMLDDFSKNNCIYCYIPTSAYVTLYYRHPVLRKSSKMKITRPGSLHFVWFSKDWLYVLSSSCSNKYIRNGMLHATNPSKIIQNEENRPCSFHFGWFSKD